jgi:hypothetical protein
MCLEYSSKFQKHTKWWHIHCYSWFTHLTNLLPTWSSHSSEYGCGCLLCCCTVHFGTSLPTFHMSLLPPSLGLSGCDVIGWWLTALHRETLVTNYKLRDVTTQKTTICVLCLLWSFITYISIPDGWYTKVVMLLKYTQCPVLNTGFARKYRKCSNDEHRVTTCQVILISDPWLALQMLPLLTKEAVHTSETSQKAANIKSCLITNYIRYSPSREVKNSPQFL